MRERKRKRKKERLTTASWQVIDTDPYAPHVHNTPSAHNIGGVKQLTQTSICPNSHFFRVIRYARPSDYAVGIATAAAAPAALLAMERISPSRLPSHAVRGIFRLTVGIGLCAGFLRFYNRPSCMPILSLFSPLFFLFFILIFSISSFFFSLSALLLL